MWVKLLSQSLEEHLKNSAKTIKVDVKNENFILFSQPNC